MQNYVNYIVAGLIGASLALFYASKRIEQVTNDR